MRIINRRTAAAATAALALAAAAPAGAAPIGGIPGKPYSGQVSVAPPVLQPVNVAPPHVKTTTRSNGEDVLIDAGAVTLILVGFGGTFTAVHRRRDAAARGPRIPA
jgi:hypothetical protein